MKHVMIDIETMGVNPYSAIVSIAAVRFDFKKSQLGPELYLNISLESCMEAGLKIESDTVIWWLEQNESARQALLNTERIPLTLALESLSAFILPDDYVWGNSPRFDMGLLQNAYERVGMSTPWRYTNERDVRTLVALAPSIKEQFPFEGTRHNALDDCKHQVKYCREVYKWLNSNAL